MRTIYRVYVWLDFVSKYLRFESQEFQSYDEAEGFMESIGDFLPKLGLTVLSSDIHKEDVPFILGFVSGDFKLVAK